MRIHRLVLVEALARLGLVGALGAALLALSALGAVLVVLPAHEHAAELAHDVEQGRARLARLRSGEEVQAAAPEAQAARFHDALPEQRAATAAIDRIYAAAEQEKLSLARGEYSLVIEPATGLAQYQILLPVRGTYPQIRRFVGTALDAVPALGLEDLSLQRKKIGDAQVDARLRMTLHLARRP